MLKLDRTSNLFDFCTNYCRPLIPMLQQICQKDSFQPESLVPRMLRCVELMNIYQKNNLTRFLQEQRGILDKSSLTECLEKTTNFITNQLNYLGLQSLEHFSLAVSGLSDFYCKAFKIQQSCSRISVSQLNDLQQFFVQLNKIFFHQELQAFFQREEQVSQRNAALETLFVALLKLNAQRIETKFVLQQLLRVFNNSLYEYV